MNALATMQEFFPYIEHVSFQASIEQLTRMIAWVHEKIQKSCFSENERLKIELAMEEALVNVIHHAYPHRSARSVLEIVMNYKADQCVEFTIIDNGQPFNPLLQSGRLDFQAGLEERQEGGLGILFMKRCMDEVHYERQHPFNILTLIKKS